MNEPLNQGVLPDALDVVELLTLQHRRLETLLKAWALAAEFQNARRLASLAVEELAVHLSAEEHVFYPAVRASSTDKVLLESLEEHLSLKRLLVDLMALTVMDETYAPKCQVLEEQARHHHKEEEEHLFPWVQQHLEAGERKQLGARVLAHEEVLRASGSALESLKEQTKSASSLP